MLSAVRGGRAGFGVAAESKEGVLCWMEDWKSGKWFSASLLLSLSRGRFRSCSGNSESSPELLRFLVVESITEEVILATDRRSD